MSPSWVLMRIWKMIYLLCFLLMKSFWNNLLSIWDSLLNLMDNENNIGFALLPRLRRGYIFSATNGFLDGVDWFLLILLGSNICLLGFSMTYSIRSFSCYYKYLFSISMDGWQQENQFFLVLLRSLGLAFLSLTCSRKVS